MMAIFCFYCSNQFISGMLESGNVQMKISGFDKIVFESYYHYIVKLFNIIHVLISPS